MARARRFLTWLISWRSASSKIRGELRATKRYKKAVRPHLAHQRGFVGATRDVLIKLNEERLTQCVRDQQLEFLDSSLGLPSGFKRQQPPYRSSYKS